MEWTTATGPIPASGSGFGRRLRAFLSRSSRSPFILLLPLVRGRWDPLLDIDQGVITELHDVALRHDEFVSS